MSIQAYGEQTTLAWRKQRAGQRLIVGFSGTSPSDELRALCKETTPAGFVLFSRNIEEPTQVRELCRELASLLPSALPPLLSVDQEGGRVQRLVGTKWPPLRWVGNASDLSVTTRFGRCVSDELVACGFNLNWAPVADVSGEEAHSVIGDRSFGSDPDRVSQQVVAYMAGATASGVISGVKHFPGHGGTTTDSHEDLPVIEKDRRDLERCDMTPFQAAIESGVGVVMAGHIRYPAFDEVWPASLSRQIIGGVLRGQLGFDGVVVTDDLDMGALDVDGWPLQQQLEMGCLATGDLFLMCHHSERQFEAYEHLVRLQEEDPMHDTLSEDSEKRLMCLRERFFIKREVTPGIDMVGCREHLALAARIGDLGAP